MGLRLDDRRPPALTVRRVLVGLVLTGAVAAFGGDPFTSATSPDPLTTTDGRHHACGVVTEHGVTEHLDTYRDRCGDLP